MERLPERIGMKVYDSELREIGKVDGLKYPENATAPGIEPATVDAADRDDATLVEDVVAEAFGREEVPSRCGARCCAMATCTGHEGTVFGDRYILPEQIARMTGDGIQLNVTKDALIKGRIRAGINRSPTGFTGLEMTGSCEAANRMVMGMLAHTLKATQKSVVWVRYTSIHRPPAP